jgi:hypothetical protein
LRRFTAEGDMAAAFDLGCGEVGELAAAENKII